MAEGGQPQNVYYIEGQNITIVGKQSFESINISESVIHTISSGESNEDILGEFESDSANTPALKPSVSSDATCDKEPSVFHDPLHKIGYAKAAKLLYELRKSQGSGDLDILLKIVECELHLKRGREDESISILRDFVFSSGNLHAFEARNKAYSLRKCGNHVLAIILYKISNDLYSATTALPDDKLRWISDRVVIIQKSTKKLISAGGRSRDIGIKYGIKYMEESLGDLRNVTNASTSSSVQYEAKCLAYLAFIYNHAGDYQKSILFVKEGVAVLKNHSSADAAKTKYYAWSLHQIGKSLFELNKLSEAEKYFVKAVEAYEKATDFTSDIEKQVITIQASGELDLTRSKLSKPKQNK